MADAQFSAEQLERYARQLVLERFGAEAQTNLGAASVLVVGAGGLGAPVVMYLAGAGIGRLGIVDDDHVERSNLHRQMLHGEDDIGRSKVESAAEWVAAHNPDVDVEAVDRTLELETVGPITEGYDLVVDATDRFEPRFLINDACTLAGIPFIHGAVYRFEGQIIAFDPADEGPCYRCLFPEAPPPGTVPDCATAGVLGPVPGIIGCLQASEAIKIASGILEPRFDRLIVVDTLDLAIDHIDIAPDPTCPICSNEATVQSMEQLAYDERYRISAA